MGALEPISAASRSASTVRRIRLVAQFTSSGVLTLIQELDGERVRMELSAGEYAINETGVWHTADVSEPTTALFIIAGAGTKIRPRD